MTPELAVGLIFAGSIAFILLALIMLWAPKRLAGMSVRFPRM